MLTDREKEVLVLIHEGLSSREIGNRLSRSEHTVKSHVRNIMQKWHVSTRMEIIREAIYHGLLR
jgi:DNA-binding NarL/FixJ family response regulator